MKCNYQVYKINDESLSYLNLIKKWLVISGYLLFAFKYERELF